MDDPQTPVHMSQARAIGTQGKAFLDAKKSEPAHIAVSGTAACRPSSGKGSPRLKPRIPEPSRADGTFAQSILDSRPRHLPMNPVTVHREEVFTGWTSSVVTGTAKPIADGPGCGSN